MIVTLCGRPVLFYHVTCEIPAATPISLEKEKKKVKKKKVMFIAEITPIIT